MTISIDPNYYNIVASIESGGNPNAGSSTSSAGGLFGFLTSTTNALGGNGQAAMSSLTQQNAQALVANGLDVTTQNLYTLHFLGQGQGLGALTAPSSAPLSAVVDPSAIASNPQLKGLTVGQFSSYIAGVTGGNVGPNGTPAGPSDAQLAGTAAKESSQFAVDIASGNYVGALSDGVQDILGVFGIGSRKPGGDSSTNSKPSTGSPLEDEFNRELNDLFGSGADGSGGLFTAHTATRTAFVIIGIILVGVAVIYLAANSDAGKTVINNVKETAKTVATTAVVAA